MVRGEPWRDHRWMRGRWLVIVVLAGIAAGCASEDRPAPAAHDAATDRAAVVARVRTYLDAYVGGRAEQACAQYTPALRAQDDRRARDAGFGGGCPEVLAVVSRRLLDGLSPARRAELLRRLPATRVQVQLHGDRALATLTLAGEQTPSGRRMELRRVGATDWRISHLAVPIGVRWP
jgi:hypothetical protein